MILKFKNEVRVRFTSNKLTFKKSSSREVAGARGGSVVFKGDPSPLSLLLRAIRPRMQA